MKQKKRILRWVRLDNAAKIYPAARRKNWSNVFRQSATLYEDVDLDILRSALDVTVKRFPSIAARLRKGLFWYYLQQVEAAPEISEEYSYPLCFMSNEEMRKCAFRVIAYKDRIAVEFFHSLTDGAGALVFLKSLVAEYLEQKHGITIPAGNGILDRKQKPQPEELEDCFPKHAGRVAASRKDTNAWRMSGAAQTDGYLNQLCFKLSSEELRESAHKYGCTVTAFLGAVMMMALQNLQREKTPRRRMRKRIKLLIPVNLRLLYGENTLRNFAMYTIPELDPRIGYYDFEEICKIVHHKMGLEITPKHMSGVIAKNVADEQNLFVRLIPLPIKNLVMKAIFDSVGEKRSCLSMSNLGVIRLPEEMSKYVRRMDFILGVQAEAPYNCGVLTYGDTVYVNFIRNIKKAELERHFFEVLKTLGLSATVESNQS